MNVTTNKITRHRELVKKNFAKLEYLLSSRAIQHDISKFEPEEFAGFEEADSAELYKEYGKSDYHKKLKENKGIALHLSKNSHHPEYFKNGISDMSFLDIVEMVVDWKSASETYGNDFMESIKYSVKRFKCDKKQEWLIKMIAEVLD